MPSTPPWRRGSCYRSVEPHLNGPGGDVPILLRRPQAAMPRRLRAGSDPGRPLRAAFGDLGLDPDTGIRAVPATVPGPSGPGSRSWSSPRHTASAPRYWTGHRLCGGRLPCCCPKAAGAIAVLAPLFRDEWTEFRTRYLVRVPPRPGSRMRNPALAETYRRVLKEAEAAGPGREQQIRAAHQAFYGVRRRGHRRPAAARLGSGRHGRRHRRAADGDDWPPGGHGRGAGSCRTRASRCTTRSVVPEVRSSSSSSPPGGLRPRGDGPGQRRLPPHRDRVRQAGDAGPGGLVGDPDFTDVPLAALLDPGYTRAPPATLSTAGPPRARAARRARGPACIDPPVGRACPRAGRLAGPVRTLQSDPAGRGGDRARGDTSLSDGRRPPRNWWPRRPAVAGCKSSPVIPASAFHSGTRGQMAGWRRAPHSLARASGPGRR